MKNIKVTILGSKKDGFILTVINKEEMFIDDIAVNFKELVEIKKVLDKKLAPRK